jgi:antitoxin component of RelBE/YafQ-DinJ toxin-antitoxin module
MMLTRLALFSHIPFDVWANTDPVVVMTAMKVIDDDERARRREEAKMYARSRR